jgi:hypothetical protein
MGATDKILGVHAKQFFFARGAQLGAFFPPGAQIRDSPIGRTVHDALVSGKLDKNWHKPSCWHSWNITLETAHTHKQVSHQIKLYTPSKRGSSSRVPTIVIHPHSSPTPISLKSDYIEFLTIAASWNHSDPCQKDVSSRKILAAPIMMRGSKKKMCRTHGDEDLNDCTTSPRLSSPIASAVTLRHETPNRKMSETRQTKKSTNKVTTSTRASFLVSILLKKG